MISDVYQFSLSATFFVQQGATANASIAVSQAVMLPAGATFSAQMSLASQVLTINGTDDPIFASNAYILRYVTLDQQITWISPGTAGDNIVSNIANGWFVQFGLELSGLSAGIDATSTATVFVGEAAGGARASAAAGRRGTKRHGSYVVYEASTGRVVHVMHVDVLAGAKDPAASGMEREAMSSGARTSGLAETALGVLAMGELAWKRGTSLSVEPSTKALQVKPVPRRTKG